MQLLIHKPQRRRCKMRNSVINVDWKSCPSLGGGDNLHFFDLESVHRGIQFSDNSKHFFAIYLLFRSFKKKHARTKLLFHVRRHSGRGVGSAPQGGQARRSSAENRLYWHRGGWRCTGMLRALILMTVTKGLMECFRIFEACMNV